MPLEGDAQGALSCALLGCSVACAALAILRGGAVPARFEAHASALEHDLRFLNAAWTGLQLARWHGAAVGSCVAAAALAGSAQLLALSLALALAPSHCLRVLRRRRTARIEAQLDAWLTALAHALRANPALGEGLASSGRVVTPPLAEELALLLRENALGSPLDRALDDMARRIGSPVVSTALATLRIARMTGGDFVHTLETSAATLREMARLEGVVRTKTADGRAQALVVAILPIPMMATLTQLAPDLLAPLWQTASGQLLITAASVVWLIAILMARRFTQVRI